VGTKVAGLLNRRDVLMHPDGTPEEVIAVTSDIKSRTVDVRVRRPDGRLLTRTFGDTEAVMVVTP
jgi:hypothetical protein